jgi:hypothetical protein
VTTVLFLAQNPKTAHNVLHPLDGTRSKRTFDMWLRMLGSPDHVLMNASQRLGRVSWKQYDAANVAHAAAQCTHHVALGAYASGLLERLGVVHFTLPHPSGLNRKLNDRAELEAQLRLCRLYVQSARGRQSVG